MQVITGELKDTQAAQIALPASADAGAEPDPDDIEQVAFMLLPQPGRSAGEQLAEKGRVALCVGLVGSLVNVLALPPVAGVCWEVTPD